MQNTSHIKATTLADKNVTDIILTFLSWGPIRELHLAETIQDYYRKQTSHVPPLATITPNTKGVCTCTVPVWTLPILINQTVYFGYKYLVHRNTQEKSNVCG